MSNDATGDFDYARGIREAEGKIAIEAEATPAIEPIEARSVGYVVEGNLLSTHALPYAAPKPGAFCSAVSVRSK